MNKDLISEARRFRQAIDEAKYEFSSRDRMRGFPRGCCDDATDLFAHHVYRVIGIESVQVNGSYYDDYDREKNDWHTWLEIDGVIYDLTADQFIEYHDIYIGGYDNFHKRYEQDRKVYRGFLDLGEGCHERMNGLYDKIMEYM